MEKISKVLKITGVFAGLIIGAGFASGKELMEFFIAYGDKWIYGIALMGVVFALLGAMLLSIIYEYRPKNYQAFLILVGGKKLGRVLDFISGAFLCVLFCTMAAASGAMAKEAFGLAPQAGVLLLLGACYIVFLCGTKGIVFVNGILTPCMLLIGILLGCYACLMQAHMTGNFYGEANSFGKWAIAAILYVSYNSITAGIVLLSLQELLTDRKIGIYAGLCGGLCMALLGGAIGIVLYWNRSAVEGFSIPMLAVMRTYRPLIHGLYLFMLAAAIFTTALGNGYGALIWLTEKIPLPMHILSIPFFTLAFFFSSFGFHGFVNTIYPFFGYLGLLQIVLLCKFTFKHKGRK